MEGIQIPPETKQKNFLMTNAKQKNRADYTLEGYDSLVVSK